MRHHVKYINGTRESVKSVVENALASKANFFRGKQEKAVSVAVFDLDETIIDRSDTLVSNTIVDFYKGIRKDFHYVILWSHGNKRHVDRVSSTLDSEFGITFDCIIHRGCVEDVVDKQNDVNINKGAGKVLQILNKKFKVTSLYMSVLIDDLPSNFTNDYLFYIKIPTRCDNTRKVDDLLSRSLDTLQLLLRRGTHIPCSSIVKRVFE